MFNNLKKTYTLWRANGVDAYGQKTEQIVHEVDLSIVPTNAQDIRSNPRFVDVDVVGFYKGDIDIKIGDVLESGSNNLYDYKYYNYYTNSNGTPSIEVTPAHASCSGYLPVNAGETLYLDYEVTVTSKHNGYGYWYRIVWLDSDKKLVNYYTYNNYELGYIGLKSKLEVPSGAQYLVSSFRLFNDGKVYLSKTPTTTSATKYKVVYVVEGFSTKYIYLEQL